MNKKALGFIVIVLLITMRVQAQSSRGLRFKVSCQTNFLSGVSGVHSIVGGQMVNYVTGFMPSMGTGFSVGYSVDWVYLDLCVVVNYGISDWNSVRYNQKIDHVISLNMGFKCWQWDRLGIDIIAGVGYGVSSLYLSNYHERRLESISMGSLLLPVSTVLWFGDTYMERNRFGIFVEYMVPIAPIGCSYQLGYSNIHHIIDVYPGTLSLGVKYQF